MKITKTIDTCYKNCPFFGRNMEGIECRHPYFDSKPAYSGMIITIDNIRNHEIPEECPLKIEETIIVHKLKS